MNFYDSMGYENHIIHIIMCIFTPSSCIYLGMLQICVMLVVGNVYVMIQ